jgi:mRNA interferase MazF
VKIERYAVHWVNLDPVVGGEIAKTRPAAIVSDDAMNEHLHTVVVCPVTSRLHPHWPFRVQARIAGKPAEIAVDQIRTVDRNRIGPRVGVLRPAVAAGVRHVVTLMYGVLSVPSEDR